MASALMMAEDADDGGHVEVAVGAKAPIIVVRLVAKKVDAVAKKNGLDPNQFCKIDNACPMDDVTQGGVSAEEMSKEKLEWKDVFDLAEWFRPGTLQKSDSFDPNKMT